MAVKIQGEHTFDAPRESVWEALLDPEVLSRTLPGCEELKAAGENVFEGALNMRVGPVQGRFQGKVTLSDLNPPEGYALHLEGQGAPGFMEGKGELALAENGASTVMRYDVEAQVGGRIAGVGQRLLDSSAKSITRQAIEGLDRQIKARTEAAEGGGEGDAEKAAAPPPEAPSQAAFAAEVAKDVLDDLVPPKRRPWLLIAGLAVAAVVIFLGLRACGA